MYSGWRRPLAVSLSLVMAVILAGCSNAPPPEVVEDSSQRPTTEEPSSQPMPTEVVVGVDRLEGGFNPHTLADLSPTSSALASLMLPSVFRPGMNGELQLDKSLMESAEVVEDAEKFTVRYEIKTDAGWSDGAPVAAEDFVYLWEQLRSQPGVANPAGYRLIDEVSSLQGGKTVQVTFAKPYPGWKSLFSNLLPAHLLKDAPRGWSTALERGYPASGGPFAIRQVDLDRGEIILQRNERYWGRPAASDRIVLRAGDQSSHVSALRSGDSHLALFGASGETMQKLRQLDDELVQLSTIPRPATMQVLLRPESPRLADTRVRRGVRSALDREALIDVGTGNGPASQLPARAHVFGPSQDAYHPTDQGSLKPDPQAVHQQLSDAGYERVGGTWTRDGSPLSLVIAAPFEHDRYVEIANTVAEQLRAEGIEAQVQTPTGDELFTELLPANPLAEESGEEGTVDMAIAPRPVGGDPAALMASSFGCATSNPSDEQPFPFSPTGFCDPLLQPTIDAAMTGQMPFDQALQRVESTVWSEAISVPLYQQAQVLAVRRDVSGVLEGFGLLGPFSTAADWVGTPADNDGW